MYQFIPLSPLGTVQLVCYVVYFLFHCCYVTVSTHPLWPPSFVLSQVQYEDLVTEQEALSVDFLVVPLAHFIRRGTEVLAD